MKTGLTKITGLASLLLVVLFCPSEAPITAQGTPQKVQQPTDRGAGGATSPTGEDEIVRVRTREVFFEVLVRDKRTGAPVADLTRENFAILDDGKPRRLSHFSRTGDSRKRPLALMLVLDLRPNGSGRFLRQPEFAKPLAATLGNLPPEDDVAILVLSVAGQWGKLKWLTDFTRDRAEITTALASVPSLVGEKGIFREEYWNSFGDTIREAARIAMQQRVDSQVVLLLVSNSINSFDSLFFAEREKMDAELLRGSVMFSALTFDLSAKTKTVVLASKPLFILARASLVGNEQHFAKLTGGEALDVDTPEELAEGLERIVNGLVARYSLAFAVGKDVPNDGRLHRLQVKVTARDATGKKRKLDVRVRGGYYLPQTDNQ